MSFKDKVLEVIVSNKFFMGKAMFYDYMCYYVIPIKDKSNVLVDTLDNISQQYIKVVTEKICPYLCS